MSHVKGKIIKVGVTNQYGQVIFNYQRPTSDLEVSLVNSGVSVSNNNLKAFTTNKAEMKETGIPIAQVLIAMLAIFGLIAYRRKQ